MRPPTPVTSLENILGVALFEPRELLPHGALPDDPHFDELAAPHYAAVHDAALDHAAFDDDSGAPVHYDYRSFYHRHYRSDDLDDDGGVMVNADHLDDRRMPMEVTDGLCRSRSCQQERDGGTSQFGVVEKHVVCTSLSIWLAGNRRENTQEKTKKPPAERGACGPGLEEDLTGGG